VRIRIRMRVGVKKVGGLERREIKRKGEEGRKKVLRKLERSSKVRVILKGFRGLRREEEVGKGKERGEYGMERREEKRGGWVWKGKKRSFGFGLVS
jgi:hypothetical protein